MTTQMQAPSGVSGKIITSTGHSYTIDNFGLINAQVVDVVDLLRAGFTVVSGAAARDNLAATTAPTTANDSTQDYAVGSMWVNLTGGTAYICVDATASAAVWIQIGPGTGTFRQPVPLMLGRSATGLVLDATGGAGLFKIAETPGTSGFLQGEDANNNTKTDNVIFEVPLPNTYVGAANITAAVYAKLTGAGTPGTKTLAVKAYRQLATGLQGANLGPAAQAIVAAGSTLSFTITGATLLPGERLIVGIETVLQETASSALAAQIGSVTLT